MAAINLLPGMGGQYVSEIFSAVIVNSIAADTIDCSKCGMLAVTCTSFGTGTYQLEQSFNPGASPAQWNPFGSSVSVTSSNTLFDITDGPFGVLRFRMVSLSAGTSRITITGFPIPRSF